ncbi:hypothetical protein [Paenibacillus sp. FSL E2-0151]|uniref:hypothetical protein n=1 Tax=Paenibacillus sp. FSL E2-0151 TaxID=2921357 RepID=UPI0030EC4134
MSEETIYLLDDIRIHVQDLIDEMDDNCEDYLKQMRKIIQKRNSWKKKEVRRRIRKLSYTMTGHYIDIVETFKKCNDYVYLNNHSYAKGEKYINNVLVDLDELKHNRRRVKNLHIDEIKKLYRKLDPFKNERNQFAHKLNNFLPISLVENKKQMVQILISYLGILDKIADKNEVKQMEKRNAYIEKTLQNIELQTSENKTTDTTSPNLNLVWLIPLLK